MTRFTSEQITIRLVVKKECWINDNAFCCRVDTYILTRTWLFFTKWVHTNTSRYASFDYFLKEKAYRYKNYIMEVV